MSYSGKTFDIPFSGGGLTFAPNTDDISPVMMVDGTRNIDLHVRGRGTRGGTAHVNTTVIPGLPRIMGLYDFILRNGNQFMVMATSDGNLYRDESNTIKTGLTANRQTNFEVMNNKLYAVNGADTPQLWTGSGDTSDLGSLPGAWSSGNYPSYFIKHGRGLSERMFALGIANDPSRLYYSTLNNGVTDATFTGAGSGSIYIETGDGDGIVGGIEFGDRLILFSKTRAYILDDTDTDTANWGYSQAQWGDGAAHGRVLIKTPNDLVAMTEDGDIYSVIAAESYGDYQQASIARPAFIDTWIREECNLSLVDDFHGVYDPVLRAIYFFVVRTGQTQIDRALVYYIDRGPQQGWMIHDNLTSVSGFSASSSALFKAAAGSFKIYTGGYSGFVWKLNEESVNDNSNGYRASIKTPNMPFQDAQGLSLVRLTKKYLRGWGIVQAKGDFDINVDIWVDGIKKTSQTLNMIGSTEVWGGANWGAFAWGSKKELIEKTFDIGTTGKRIQFEFYNENVDEGFFMSKEQIDYKALGKRPAA